MPLLNTFGTSSIRAFGRNRIVRSPGPTVQPFNGFNTTTVAKTTSGYLNNNAPEIVDVTFSNGTYLAIGYPSSNYGITWSTSSNGINWTAPANYARGEYQFYSVAGDNDGNFIIVGRDMINNYTGYLKYNSSSGMDASATFLAVGGPSSFHDLIAYSPTLNRFVILGGQKVYSGTYSSISGAAVLTQSTYIFAAVTWSSTLEKFVVMGRSTSGVVSYTSSDGITWSGPSDIITSSAGSVVTGVAWSPVSNIFVAAMYKVNTFYEPYYSTSTDGTTWTTLARIDGNIKPESIRCNEGGQFVIIGQNTHPGNQTPRYTTSTNGTTWSTITQLTSGQDGLTGLTVGPTGNFVAVGKIGTAPQPMLVAYSF
jgi:hypothetical protein